MRKCHNAVMLFITFATCIAQDCREITLTEAYERADVVFLGTAEEIDHLNFVSAADGKRRNLGATGSNDRVVVRFAVERMWKGNIAERRISVHGIMHRTMGADYEFVVGRKYLVYGREVPAFEDVYGPNRLMLSVGLGCVLRLVQEDFRTDLAALGPGRQPIGEKAGSASWPRATRERQADKIPKR